MTTINTNELLKFVVEKDYDEVMLPWIFENGKPTNVEECLKIAISNNQTAQITILAQHLTPKPVIKPDAEEDTKKSIQYPLVIVDHKINMSSNKKDTGKNSVFMMTVHMHPEKALRELEAGLISLEEINYQNEAGWTVLMYVARNASKIAKAELIVQKLLDLGADVNLKNTRGSTVLTLTANYTSDSTDKVFEILLQVPTLNINHLVPNGGTALIYASQYSTTKTVELLLKHSQIDVNFQTDNGDTALIMACLHCLTTSSISTVKMLLNHPKIDIHLKNKAGKSAIAYCPTEALTEVSELFFAKIENKLV
jgi:hypothetical protein